MRSLILALMFAGSCLGQSCLGQRYQDLFGVIGKSYKKQQRAYTGSVSPRYIYNVIPLELFPFFVMSKDTVNLLSTMSEKSLCSFDYTIMSRADKVSEHVVVAVLSYLKWENNPPPEKIYRLHFLYFEPISQEWVDERSPIVVVFQLTNKDEGWYAKK